MPDELCASQKSLRLLGARDQDTRPNRVAIGRLPPVPARRSGNWPIGSARLDAAGTLGQNFARGKHSTPPAVTPRLPCLYSVGCTDFFFGLVFALPHPFTPKRSFTLPDRSLTGARTSPIPPRECVRLFVCQKRRCPPSLPRSPPQRYSRLIPRLTGATQCRWSEENKKKNKLP